MRIYNFPVYIWFAIKKYFMIIFQPKPYYCLKILRTEIYKHKKEKYSYKLNVYKYIKHFCSLHLSIVDSFNTSGGSVHNNFGSTSRHSHSIHNLLLFLPFVKI